MKEWLKDNWKDFAALCFIVLVVSLIANAINGCATVEKYLPETTAEAESSGADIQKAADKKGAKTIKAGKKDLIKGIEKL